MTAAPFSAPRTLSEQRAIAHILGTLDDKIELNRRMNQTIEEMARALFKSWFVDFDPVRAKAALKQHPLGNHFAIDIEPSDNGNALAGNWTADRARDFLNGMDSQIVNLFPDRLMPSELGNIPKGWGVKALGELADVTSGKRPGRRVPVAHGESQIPLWGGNGPMGFVTAPLVDFPILLTGRVGTLGSIFRITTPCWPSDNTLMITPSCSRLFNFLFFQMHMIDFHSLNRGSTQPLLTQGDLKVQRSALPTDDVLDCFHSITTQLLNGVESRNRESLALARLRDCLLPDLISGETRIEFIA